VMKCVQARRLFSAFWDDDATQAEREWLEAHFVACASCRREYEEFSQSLELAGSLPRVEPMPDMVERTLARARRASPTPDRLPTPGVQWVPATAAAAVLLVLGAMISPWVGIGPGPRVASRSSEPVAARESKVVQPMPVVAEGPLTGSVASRLDSSANDVVVAIPDSLFDHREDVEFILDPVTVRRDRASVNRPTGKVQAEQAVITF